MRTVLEEHVKWSEIGFGKDIEELKAWLETPHASKEGNSVMKVIS